MTSSVKDLLTEYSPANLTRQCRQIKTPAQAFDSGYPTLSVIGKYQGQDFTEAYIAIWITNLVDFMQVGKKMGEQQILETASLVMDDYYMLNLADINLIFTRAKKGYFGELYDRLDGAIILTWFKRYFDDRCEAAEGQSIREHNELRKGDNKRVSGKTVQLMKDAMNQYQLDKIKTLFNNHKIKLL